MATEVRLDVIGAAADAAAAAATRANVEIGTVDDIASLREVIALLDRVWANTGPPPISLEHMRALAHAGNYVAVARDADSGELLAATVAFFAAPPGHVLHSDVTGVDPSARERRLGFALKVHQRAWALQRGIDEVRWTYDPLVSRNAYFNLRKLRAQGRGYVVDFYGDMDDGINTGQGSDRLLVSWSLADPDVAAACSGHSPAPTRDDQDAPALVELAGGAPVVGQERFAGARFVSVAVPHDIESVRASDPALALRWRMAVRSTLGDELAAAGRVVSFDTALGYLIERERA